MTRASNDLPMVKRLAIHCHLNLPLQIMILNVESDIFNEQLNKINSTSFKPSGLRINLKFQFHKQKDIKYQNLKLCKHVLENKV